MLGTRPSFLAESHDLRKGQHLQRSAVSPHVSKRPNLCHPARWDLDNAPLAVVRSSALAPRNGTISLPRRRVPACQVVVELLERTSASAEGNVAVRPHEILDGIPHPEAGKRLPSLVDQWAVRSRRSEFIR